MTRTQDVTQGFKSLNASGCSRIRERKRAGNAGPSLVPRQARIVVASARIGRTGIVGGFFDLLADLLHVFGGTLHRVAGNQEVGRKQREPGKGDRKSTRLNSSH